MTLQAQEEKQKSERLAYLFDAYDYWLPKYADNLVSSTVEGQTITQTGFGLYLSEASLRIVVERHFFNVAAYKSKYGFASTSRLNAFKVAGFTMYWLSKIRPIYETRNEPMFTWANEEFAIGVGMGMAGIDIQPRTNIPLIRHLRTGLQTSCLSPESLVLMLMALVADARQCGDEDSGAPIAPLPDFIQA